VINLDPHSNNLGRRQHISDGAGSRGIDGINE
jgi:hypothetical protein